MKVFKISNMASMPALCAVVMFVVIMNHATAEAASCAPPDGISYTLALDVVEGSVSYDFTRSREELQGMGTGISSGRNRFISGLTSAKISYNLGGNFMTIREPSGAVCIWPNGVKARIGYDATTIYVDNRYIRGSCENSAVLEHEYEHLRINRETLARYAPVIRVNLQAVINRIFPIMAGSEKEAQAQAFKVLSDALTSNITAMEQERDRLHAVLDSPAGYERVRKQCGLW